MIKLITALSLAFLFLFMGYVFNVPSLIIELSNVVGGLIAVFTGVSFLSSAAYFLTSAIICIVLLSISTYMYISLTTKEPTEIIA